MTTLSFSNLEGLESMGAETFEVVATGKTAKAAFKDAQEKARYDYGHRGYTGTIAEKDSFVMLTPPEGEDPRAFANRLIDEADERVQSTTSEREAS